MKPVRIRFWTYLVIGTTRKLLFLIDKYPDQDTGNRNGNSKQRKQKSFQYNCRPEKNKQCAPLIVKYIKLVSSVLHSFIPLPLPHSPHSHLFSPFPFRLRFVALLLILFVFHFIVYCFCFCRFPLLPTN